MKPTGIIIKINLIHNTHNVEEISEVWAATSWKETNRVSKWNKEVSY